jgi:hypothetical protein
MRRNVRLVVPVHLWLVNVATAVPLDSLDGIYLSVYAPLSYELFCCIKEKLLTHIGKLANRCWKVKS